MWKRFTLVLVMVASVLGSGCFAGILYPAVVPPEIVPVEGAVLDQPPVYTFLFEDRVETIRIPIDPAVYAGAKGADRRLYLFEDLSREDWIPIYYRAFINDTDQDSFYADLLAALRHIRDERGLDDDRYLELVTVFVQSIPYQTDSTIVEPKFPIETYTDGVGDCDDKSLLLAGLLAREGYGVALFYFEDERHMAVGLKARECAYGNTGYAYIEATNASYVGIPPLALSDGTVLHTDPLVIPIGDGPRSFSSFGQIKTIKSALDRSLARIEALEPEIASRDEELQAAKEALSLLDARMDLLSRSGKVQQYNHLVPEYNRLAAEYNSMILAYNSLLEESRGHAEIYNHLIAHAYDRPGSYRLAGAHLSG